MSTEMLTERIMDACQAQNVPEPYYEVWCDHTIVIVFPLPDKEQKGKEDVLENVLNDKSSELTERQQFICDRLIKTGHRNVLDNVLENVREISKSLAKYLGVSERTIRRDMSDLQTKGIIRRDGPDNGGRWIVV